MDEIWGQVKAARPLEKKSFAKIKQNKDNFKLCFEMSPEGAYE
jgi:hypothetical protein